MRGFDSNTNLNIVQAENLRNGVTGVLSQNGINGVDVAVKTFCGVDLDQPIWGELQHSLWLNDQKKFDRRPKLFPTVFTWNDFFMNRYTIPIGDPLLYLERIVDSSCHSQSSRAGLFPSAKLHSHNLRLNSDNLNIEISHIDEVYSRAIKFYPNVEFDINLHPTLSTSTLLIKALSDRGYSVLRDLDLESRFTLLKNCHLLVSDYPGAHVFRAAYFKCETLILPRVRVDGTIEDYDNRIRNLVETFCSTNNLMKKKEVAEHFLGSRYKMSKMDLRKVLGFTGIKRVLGPTLSSVYNARKKINAD